MPDLHTLLLNWQSIDAEVHGLEIERHALEVDIAEAMSENQAEFASIPGVEATLKPVLDYLKQLDGPFQQVG